ncbi:MAG: 50S ribosomal protein L20 [Deltaproteobacteria bacterium]|nr:50S ribosomal protein L20 [Deltaproteobacteria bacterium]
MSRATNTPASRRRRKKILKTARGYRGGQSKLFRTAVERVARALQFAYRDRRVKKREFRALWITRIGIAAKLNGLSYSRLIAGLKKANIAVDRKVLADLAVRAPKAFADVVEKAKAQLAS